MFVHIYDFVTGPFAWLGWAVFFFGSIWKLYSLYTLGMQKDRSSLAYMKVRYGARSILQWLIPFGTLGWRTNPVVTVVTFAFHICLILVPIFLGAHNILLEQWFGFSLPSFSDQVADIMTMVVIASCVFFAGRRLFIPDVRFVTSSKDWGVLALVVSPFLTGFLAYHQIFNYEIVIVLHVICGMLWLALIPFTRLSHMLVSWYSRAYIGSEFQGVRQCRDW